MAGLTRRQQAILDCIQKNIDEKGYPPSVREIGESVGLASSSTVHGHLARLEQRGYLRRDPTKPRAMELLIRSSSTKTSRMRETDRSVDVTMVPVVGRVTAGIPITAVEQIEEFFPVPSQHTGDGKLFALQVIGESMVDAGIIDGDHVLVRQQPTAQNGDIVVAMTQEGEATVKRFFREQHRIRLQPENSSMEPLYFDTVTILGKVVGVYRFFH